MNAFLSTDPTEMRFHADSRRSSRLARRQEAKREPRNCVIMLRPEADHDVRKPPPRLPVAELPIPVAELCESPELPSIP